MLSDIPSLFLLFFGVFTVENNGFLNFADDDLRVRFGNVVYAAIVFRHGERTPLHTFSTDPYKALYRSEGTGQLTKRGKQSAYELGTWIRQWYKHLIAGKSYRYDAIVVNSSDIDRTLMSAELLLAGMYPPSNEEAWNKDIHWQPIPVHSIPAASDNVISLSRPCERFVSEFQQLNNLPELREFFERHRTMFEYVSAHAGEKMSKNDLLLAIGIMWIIHDTLLYQSENNLTLPTWAQRVYPEPIKSVAELYPLLRSFTNEMRRLNGGPLLKDIVDNLKAKVGNNLRNRTFHVYSGQDTTIAALLNVLNVYNGIAPPYAACVMVELRIKNDEYFVSVLYRNSSTTAPYLLSIRGCRNIVCTFDEFIQTSAPGISDNWEYECQIRSVSKFSHFLRTDLFIIFLLLLMMALAITAWFYIEVYIMTKKRHFTYYEFLEDDIYYK